MLCICAVLVAGATALQAPRQPLSTAPSWLHAATLEQPPATSKDLLPRERYVWPRVEIIFARHAIAATFLCTQVASNRFKTRGGKAAAKFEARWANRKSRLAELEGFRYFSLFREVPVEDVVGPRRAEMVVARVWVARAHAVAGQRSRGLVRRVYRLRRAEAALLEARLLRHHPALLDC